MILLSQSSHMEMARAPDSESNGTRYQLTSRLPKSEQPVILYGGIFHTTLHQPLGTSLRPGEAWVALWKKSYHVQEPPEIIFRHGFIESS